MYTAISIFFLVCFLCHSGYITLECKNERCVDLKCFMTNLYAYFMDGIRTDILLSCVSILGESDQGNI